MKYCLWLHGKKVYSLEEVMSNFDIDSLCAYLYGGSLGRWLRSIGKESIAKKVDSCDLGGDVPRQLRQCFGLEQSANETKSEQGSFPVPDYAYEYHPFGGAAPAQPATVPANVSSFGSGSSSGVYFSGSFSSGSFSTTSSSTANYPGSFNSFISGGSLGFYSLFGSSFGRISSFSAISSRGGSYFGGFAFARTSSGSFVTLPQATAVTESEYKQTMINLSSCPLNSRGYGIHRI